MTKFRKLAEKIGESIHGYWYCCNDLPKQEAKFFEEWFKPTKEESIEYCHSRYVWMGAIGTFSSEDNNLRILALLFAEQLWNDIKEGER